MCVTSQIPVTTMIAVLLLGIDEIGIQVEEPFGECWMLGCMTVWQLHVCDTGLGQVTSTNRTDRTAGKAWLC